MTEKRNFDVAASTWDEEPRRVELAGEITAAIRAALPLSKEWNAVDFGCGTGLLTLQLAPYLGSILGVDSSQGMLDRLSMKIRNQNIENVRVQRCDHERGELPAGPFHLITSAMTLHHIPEPLQLLQSLHDLLIPGGCVALADLEAEDGSFHDDATGVFHHGFSHDMIRGMLRKASFEDVLISTGAKVLKSEKWYRVFLATARAS